MFSMKSEKLKHLKVLDNYKYRQAKIVKEGQRWRCTKRSCNVTITTDLQGNKLIKGPEKQHDHLPDDHLARQFLSNNAKCKVKEDFDVRPNKIIKQHAREAPPQIRTNLTNEDLNRARRNSYATRRSAKTALSQNIEQSEPAINSTDVKSEDGDENLMQSNDQDNGIFDLLSLSMVLIIILSNCAYV